MQDKFVISALAHIRAQSIREGIPGRKEAERLLRLYGVDPDGLHVPRKNNVRHRRGGLRRAILRVLAGGPMTAREIAAQIAPDEGCRNSVRVTLCKMRKRGQVEWDGGKWGLAPKGQPCDSTSLAASSAL